MKRCSKCNQEKEYKFFYRKKSSNDGYSNICKKCRKEYNTLNITQTQQYYQETKDKHKINSKKYYSNNKEKVIQNSINFQKNNPHLQKQYNVKWRNNNKKYFKEWRKKNYKNNPNFKLRVILGNRLNEVLKKNKTYKTNNIINILGCNLPKLKLYLESKFFPEMSWNNHGKVWEIDHIKPCISFDLTKEKEQKECFHYTNLQPLFKTTQIAENLGYKNEIGNRNKSSN